MSLQFLKESQFPQSYSSRSISRKYCVRAILHSVRMKIKIWNKQVSMMPDHSKFYYIMLIKIQLRKQEISQG